MSLKLTCKDFRPPPKKKNIYIYIHIYILYAFEQALTVYYENWSWLVKTYKIWTHRKSSFCLNLEFGNQWYTGMLKSEQVRILNIRDKFGF